jgi:3D (Asp-Asp-Asp) domain-containing protein
MTQLITQATTPHEMPVVLAPEAPAPEWQTFEITAYTAGPESTGKRPGDDGYGITASGESVSEGITSACPPSLSFGTRLEIEGLSERVCTDRGGAITEGRLDLYMTELQDALTFGRQWLNVRIIEEEPG